MAKKIIRPIKGMDIDSATNRRDDNTIYTAKNFRLNNEDSTITGKYSNIKGPNEVIKYDSTGTIEYITKVGDNLLIFVNKSSSSGILFLVKESDVPSNGTSAITLDESGYYWSTSGAHKVIEGDFKFDQIIDVKTYYESDEIQRVYWTCEDEIMRSLNVIYSSFNDPSTYDEKSLEIIPSSDLVAPILNNTITGNLLSGKIYYAYKLVNNNGAETNLSELSKSFHLTSSSENESTDYKYKGDGFDVNTNKGVNLSISTIADIFTSAKVYSIHFIDDSSLPVVKLIYDNSVSGSLILNDVGNAIEEISAEEFASSNNLLIKNGLLEIKNNRLFAANYEEEFFDIDELGYWDARSYRFKGTGVQAWTSLYTSSLLAADALTLSQSSPDYQSVSIDHDCINIDNDLDNWNIDLKNNYIYQEDGSTIGSNGLNVQVEQSDEWRAVYLDQEINPVRWNTKKTSSFSSYAFPVDGYANYSNPLMSATYKTFKPEETYRLGIQFKNSKQKKSYVKWINDFKIVQSDNSLFSYYSGPKISGSVSYITVTVDNIPDDPYTGDPMEYRIMYVPITDSERSVYWGLFSPLYKRSFDEQSNDMYSYPMAHVDFDDGDNIGKYFDFMSPDYALGDKKTYTHFSLFKYSNYSNVLNNRGFFESSSGYYYNKIYDFTNFSSVISGEVLNQFDVEYSEDINGKIPLESSDLFYRALHGNKVETATTDTGEHKSRANKGRSQIIYQTATGTSSSASNATYLGCCYFNNFESKYGGISYQERLNSGYVALSSFSTSSSRSVYGDSYMNIFEQLRMISDNNTTFVQAESKRAANPEIIAFPTISTRNLNLRTDTFFNKIYTSEESTLIHEFSGVYENPVLAGDRVLTYAQTEDMYLYNETYSREQDLLKFYEKNTSNSVISEFKNRIVASSQKILGETSDSFLQIDASTYIDVDGQYGEIVALLVFKERLYFFQNKAIGIVSVNERSQTVDTTGNTVSMGELGVLSRYDYVTKENGITNLNHIAVSNSAIYVCDEMRGVFLKISDSGSEVISITKNINSLVKSIDLSFVKVVHNRRFNEVLFYYRPDPLVEESDCIVYSEITNSFTGMYDSKVEPNSSIAIDSSTLFDELIVDDNSAKIYSINDGSYNKFKLENLPSEITFLVTSKEDMKVLFTEIEFSLKKLNGGLATIRIYNDECDTGDLQVYNSTKESFGKVRTNKLRNYLGNNERMLSDHIFVTITTGVNIYGTLQISIGDLVASFSEYNYFG